jgi:hypothetical protein
MEERTRERFKQIDGRRKGEEGESEGERDRNREIVIEGYKQKKIRTRIQKYIMTRRETERELEGKIENQRSVKGSKNSWIIHQMLN